MLLLTVLPLSSHQVTVYCFYQVFMPLGGSISRPTSLLHCCRPAYLLLHGPVYLLHTAAVCTTHWDYLRPIPPRLVYCLLLAYPSQHILIANNLQSLSSVLNWVVVGRWLLLRDCAPIAGDCSSQFDQLCGALAVIGLPSVQQQQLWRIAAVVSTSALCSSGSCVCAAGAARCKYLFRAS